MRFTAQNNGLRMGHTMTGHIMEKCLFTVVCFLSMLSFAWCGSIPLPADVPKEISKIAAKRWGSVQKTCPGLNKYSAAIKVSAVSKQVTTAGEMISFEVIMPERQSSIPPRYKSLGNHCYFDVSKDGRLLFISKRACMSVALDKDFFAETPLSEPLVISLKP